MKLVTCLFTSRLWLAAACSMVSSHAFAEPLSAVGPLGFGPAQFSEPLETDRPDFTEGAQTIEEGHLQLEGGYTFTLDDGSDGISRQHTAPEFLLRVGVAEPVELRIAWAGYVSEDGPMGESVEGTADLSIGVKVSLVEESGLVPRTSLILASTVPTGSDDLRADGWQPEAKLIWSYDLSERTGLGGNLNYQHLIEDYDRFGLPSASIALGTELSERWGQYVEYFGFYPTGSAPEQSSEHYLATGFTFALSTDAQLDVRLGTGLTDDSTDLFSGVGFAIRH